MRIRLTDERRERMIRAIQRQLEEQLDLHAGELAAGLLLDFFIRELGAPVYNQAIQDARSFLLEKLEDLEGEFYEPEAGRG
jgi:uncharacterized protein (DUF2164 family)